MYNSNTKTVILFQWQNCDKNDSNHWSETTLPRDVEVKTTTVLPSFCGIELKSAKAKWNEDDIKRTLVK